MSNLKRIFIILFLPVLTLLNACSFTTDDEAGNGLESTKKISDYKSGYLSIESESLKKSLIGENPVRRVFVHLPPSYNYNKDNYPVLYFLAGYGERVSDWVTGGYSFLSISDEMMKSKSIKEMIIVLIDGKCKLDGSFYNNSPVTGNWEDYIANEVTGAVDRDYRTIKDRSGRAIAGHSMGGYGAIHIGMKNPDVFSIVYGHTPGLFSPDGIKKSVLYNKTNINFFISEYNKISSLSDEASLAYYNDLIKSLMAEPWKTWEQMFIIAYSSAFSSLSDRVPYCNVPFDGNMNITDNEILNKWENGFGNLENKVIQYNGNLKSLKGIGLFYGGSDYYTWITEGTKYFSGILIKNGIENELHSDNGGHESNMKGRLRNYILPFISKHF